MVLLPPELRSYDGHPLAELAARVMADLAKVGVVVHVIDGSDDDSHVNGGVTLSLEGPASAGVSLAWHVPNEVRLSTTEKREKEEVFGAAATLTSAVISILTNFGHRVRTKFNDPGYPYPYIYVLPADSSS
ncbi:hypothetical protein OOK44_36030 [Streptomyces cellulosae]|uniref:Uncharacterized protein n=1 Tax=Streptomyces althioticus TaxID=83380 RepID=A0ABZ1YFX4_9ACTN|nr:hypothetical protein [Streptomyces sp.]MCX4481787.1 hypothetical protein [Streptomyces cellulosae]WTB86600.1 hypothetical protein OG837_35590 [Streptomyces cellulosae]WTB93412.1 hypothetical protein OIE99_34780 [Streptomyces cellulosae]WTC60803.1 hypothetical protein OH715_36530 [Streptomyces cellulosae]